MDVYDHLVVGIDDSLLRFYYFLLRKFFFLNVTPKLQIDSAASGGDQENLTDFMFFRWPSLEAALSISTFLFFCLHVYSDPLICERNYPTSNIK
jgi:hypothetical protein